MNIQSGENKHEAVRRRLLKTVGRMKPHQALPNERALAQTLGVSRMTLRQVLKELVNDGLVYSIHGVGTFIAETQVSKEVLLSSFTEDMNRRGLKPSSRILMKQIMVAPEDVAKALGIPAGAQVYNLERLRLADGVAVCIEDAYLAAEELPGLLSQSLSGSLYAILRDRYERPVVRAATSVSAIALNRRQAELLSDRLRAPALRFERVGFDERGYPLEYCVTIYRSGRFDLRYTVDMA